MTKAVVLCALVFAGLAAPAHAVTATGALTSEVQAVLDKGDAQQASDLADAALKQNIDARERGGLLLYRGLAHELLGSQQDAMADFTAALQIHTSPPDVREQILLQRGFLLDSLGKLHDAIGDYSVVIAMKGPVAATALNNRANIYRRQNRMGEAKRDYLAALSRGGGQPQYSWYGLGQIAEVGGDTEVARDSYARAVAAAPDYLLASQRLAALGGPLETAVSDPEVITLHPPPPVRTADARPAGVISDATPVVLHPPRGYPVPVVLHPPQHQLVSRQAAAEPGLRPALDAPATRTGRREVQLGAWRSEAEAQQGWKEAVRHAGRALNGLEPHIVVADLPGRGRYYRLRTTPGSGGVAQLCAQLTATGQGCLLARD
jgi:tetratricopeptide (TPR) repeat protein